jgi:hypothetical protein
MAVTTDVLSYAVMAANCSGPLLRGEQRIADALQAVI